MPVSMLEFKEISNEEVKNNFQDFYLGSTNYFLLVKNNIEQGLLGITCQNIETCYVSITVFEPYRFKFLSKSIIINMIEFVFSLGYKTFFTSTSWKSWASLLQRFKSYGLHLIDNKDNKIINSNETWFMGYRG